MNKKTGRKTIRKTISFILTLAMVFSMLTGIMPGTSLTAYADGTIEGSGTQENPFIIKSEEDLTEYASDGSLVNPDSSEPTYVSINNDFPISNTVFISKDTVFVGTGIVTLNGGGYLSMADSSSASLTIDGPTFLNTFENTISGSPTGAVTVKSGSVGEIESFGPFTMTGGRADFVLCCGDGSISGGTVGALLIDKMHSSEPNVEITGGIFDGSSDVPKAIIKNKGSLVIKGGKYIKTAINDLETDLKVYLAEGYSVTEEGDYYVVSLHPDKPTNVSAVNCTSADNNDGKLTGVTTAMEYKLSTAENWTDGTGSDITGLVPGTYYVRVKATETSLASDNLELTIREYIAPVTYVYYTDNGITATKHTDGNCTDYTTVTDSTTDWGTGWYVVSSDVTVSDRIFVDGTANLILCDGATLTAEKGIDVNGTKKLNIYAQDNGTGVINATGEEHSAGIGGFELYAGGILTIHGGIINATGGDFAAGIGGGPNGGVGTVTIYGGDVTANGGDGAAGIGLGCSEISDGVSGTVTIFGGTVKAIGNANGAGIGGSYGNNVRETPIAVTINGGNVTATGGNSGGAGIGGGDDSGGNSVIINGGTVIANGDSNAMGIGRGENVENSNSNGNLTLGEGMKILVSTDNSTWSDYENDNRARYMKSVEPHTHNFTEYTLSADGKTVTAICDADDCPIPEVEGKCTATFTIDAPALTTYGGNESAEASITDDYGLKGDAEVSYYATDNDENKTGDALTAAPTDAGTYWAEVSVDTDDEPLVAHIVYTIEKADTETPTIETAGFSVNYSAETFTLNDGYEVSSSASEDGIFTGNSLTAILDSETDIPKIYIRKAATNNTNASDWLEEGLTARPDAPTGLTTKEATNSDTADGKINGTTSSMEYSSDNGETWKDASDDVTLVKPGTYLVRIKETSTVPAGKAASVEVGNKLKDILANKIKEAKNYCEKTLGVNDDYNEVELAFSEAIATATEILNSTTATDDDLEEAIEDLSLAYDSAKFYEHQIYVSKRISNYLNEGDSQACKDLVSSAKTEIDKLVYDSDKTYDENIATIDNIIDKLKSDLDAQRLAEAKDAAKTELAAYRNSFDDSLYDEDGVSELNKAKTDGDTAIDAATTAEEIAAALKTAKENIDKVYTIDQKAANYVISLLDALPEPVEITWKNIGDYKDDMRFAEQAFNRLTDNQRALINDDRQKKLENLSIAETVADTINRVINTTIWERNLKNDALYDEYGIAELNAIKDKYLDETKSLQWEGTIESAQEIIDTVSENIANLRKELNAVDTISRKNAKAELEAKYDAMKNSGDYDEEGLDELKDAYNAAVEAIDAATVSDTKDDPKEKGAWQAEQEGEEALDAVKTKEEKDKEAAAKVLSEISAKTGDDTYYTGKQVELVNKPTTSLPDGYTLEYAVSTSNTEPASGWSTKTPAATEIGSYNVWCRVVEDKKNKVVASKNLTADINAKPSKGTITTDGIYCASNYPSIQAGISIHKSNENDRVEYRWVACDSGKPGEWFEVSPWTKDNNWIDWTPEKSGEYVIVCYARVLGNEEESEIQSSFGTVFHKKIKGICQMPYSGEGGGHLIGIESYDNPDNSYEYEMLILDCNLLIQNKDPWVYTTGRCKTPSNCLWTVWQPQYGYFWTLFRLYDADGNMIDELCYGFANVY